MLPKLRNFNILDDVFNDSFFTKRENEVMKTDISEKNGNYILDIDVAGCDKKDIKIELEDGYLTVSASMNKHIDEEDKKNNYIHKERFFGQCSRSFYAGEAIKESDIKASFKNGTLTLTFPKKAIKDESKKKYIQISE